MIFWKFFKETKIISFFLRTTIGVNTGYNRTPVELEQIDKSTTLTSTQKSVFKKIYMFCFLKEMKESAQFHFGSETSWYNENSNALHQIIVHLPPNHHTTMKK